MINILGTMFRGHGTSFDVVLGVRGAALSACTHR